MRRLMRLFPRAWRDRYSAEFEELLDEVPLTATVLTDVMIAAARARARAVSGWLDGRFDRLEASALAAPSAQRAGAVAAVVGGALWAATIAIGTAVDWGRYGNDLGFPLLIAAAVGLLLAQITMAAAADGSHRRALAWLGVGIGSLGAGVLSVALVAALVLERPLAVRLGWSPLEIWETGMMLTIIGAALSGLAPFTAGGLRRVSGVFLAAATLPLAAAMLLVLDGPSFPASGTGVAAAQMSAGQHGWFGGTFAVSIAGVLFGLGWVVLGGDALHAQRRPPRPSKAAHSQPDRRCDI